MKLIISRNINRKVLAIGGVVLVVLSSITVLLPSAVEVRSTWNIETVDSIGYAGSWTSLALDTSGYPHISYYEGMDYDLKYAYKDSIGWHNAVVEHIGFVGQYTSLALDNNNYPHISYYDAANTALKYAYMDSGGWHISTVDSNGTVGSDTSLALDTSGYPHISYYDATNDDLKYAYMDSGGWHTIIVDDNGDVGQHTSLALDTSGYPHISYYDATNHDLGYTYQDWYGWHFVTVDSTGEVGTWTSLALDTSGYPHISYHNETWYDYKYDLKYAYQDSAGWHISTVDSSGYVGQYTSLALDNNNYPHISYYRYYDATNTALKYAYLMGTSAPLVVQCHGPYSGYAGVPIQFTGSATGGTPPYSYAWDFDNDGFYDDSTAQNPFWVFNIPGIHTVRLQVTDNDSPATTATCTTTATISPLTTNYIQITFGCSPNEIPNQSISTNFTFFCYASAFNNTHGFAGFVDVNWALINSESNSSIDNIFGESVEFFSGWYDGTSTLSIDDGNGHTDTVVFTIDHSAFSKMIQCKWNLIGWYHDYDTTAESLGQHITNCSVVCRFNASSQEYISHVVGVPHNDFVVEQGWGLFVYVTQASLWQGEG